MYDAQNKASIVCCVNEVTLIRDRNRQRSANSSRHTAGKHRDRERSLRDVNFPIRCEQLRSNWYCSSDTTNPISWTSGKSTLADNFTTKNSQEGSTIIQCSVHSLTSKLSTSIQQTYFSSFQSKISAIPSIASIYTFFASNARKCRSNTRLRADFLSCTLGWVEKTFSANCDNFGV